MNFTWCGQSCGSTSRAFVHEKIYDAGARARASSRSSATSPASRPIPPPPWARSSARCSTTGCWATSKPARRTAPASLAGGKRPDDPALAKGFYVEPTVFADVTHGHADRARRKSSAPSCRSSNGATRRRCSTQVNAGRIRADLLDLDQRSRHRAPHRRRRSRPASSGSTRSRKHFLGAPFGGYKQSGIGREECIEELLSFTRRRTST